jgi:ribonuclease T1
MLRKGSWLPFWALLLALCLGTGVSLARGPLEGVVDNPEQATVALVALPVQGQWVWRQIHAGGPFRYEKDGTVFGNRERLLPAHKRGYYREYTVPTPGLSHRGARRIVCGGFQPARPEACYYTADHYTSFRRIVP